MISNKIDLSDYKKSYKEITRFRNDLLTVLSNCLFQYNSLDDIVFYSLKVIKPVNRYLKNNPKSIEKKAGDVLEHFKMKKLLRVSSKNLATGEVRNNDCEFEKSLKQRYIENILRLKQPPKFEYDRLLVQAEGHLQEINENIGFYNAQKFIIEFKKRNSTPKNHYERTLLDFYFRCIDEQQEILRFIYNDGLKNRAISKSSNFLINIPLSFILGVNDFSYYSSYGFNKGYFNHTQISKSAHRVGEFSYDKSIMLEKIYNSDKERFYKVFFKKHPIKNILYEINYNSNHLPISNDRKLIIEELVYLFSKKRWISFYGLALSQIEGLFSEMISFTVQKKNRKSLPNKVNAIRNYYGLSKSYFDYFEYHIPELRNTFMHGVLNGEEKNKLNSYDLLVDIHFLLEMIKTLDSAYISINNIIKKSDIQISKLEDVAMLFELYEQLTLDQKKEVNNDLKQFFKENLLEKEILKYMIFGVSEILDEKISILKNQFIKSFETEIDFETTNPKLLEEFFRDEVRKEKLNEEFLLHKDNLLQMISYNTFLRFYKKKLYGLPDEMKRIIVEVFQEQKDLIRKFSCIGSLIL